MEKSIGKFIASLRKANGYTQEELGEILGVSNKTISSWENENSNPDLAMLPIIADLFNVTCDELLRGEKIRDNLKDNNDRSEKIRKNLLKNTINKYVNMTYISIGIFLASFCLIVVGLIFSYYAFGIVLLVIGIISYLGGIIFSFITYNDYQNKVNPDEENGEYYRILLKKSLLLKCLYSFFILAPIFCYLNDKKLLNNQTYYKINEEEKENIQYNFKLKKIFSKISLIIASICFLSIIVIEIIPEPYFCVERYTLEQIKKDEYTFEFTYEYDNLIIRNGSETEIYFLTNDEEDSIRKLKEGTYTFDLFIGDYERITECQDFTCFINEIEFYVDYSDDYEYVQIIYEEEELIEMALRVTNRGSAYYTINDIFDSYYEIKDGVFTKPPRYHSLKDDIQLPILFTSILIISILIGIYFIKKYKRIY